MKIMDICIHKNLLGTNHHLLIKDEKVTRVDSIPKDCFVFDITESSFVKLLRLNSVEAPTFPNENFKNSIVSLLKDKESVIPWNKIIPRDKFLLNVKEFVKNIQDLIPSLNTSYYNNVYAPNQDIFQNLRPSVVNKTLLKKLLFIEDVPINKSSLESFLSDEEMLQPPTYSDDTITGRLKVVKGPNILHLKKDFRPIVTSRFGDNGVITSLDYKSLEPRVCLAINKPNIEVPYDIYQFVLDELGVENVERDVVKNIIISKLYGASEETVMKKIESLYDPKHFIGLVNEFFGVEELKEKLLLELNKTPRVAINNHFGRTINAINAKPYMLLNYYIQSTSVDVALWGFNKMVRWLNERSLQDFVVPLFVLHDALILDVHKDYKHVLGSLLKLGMTIELLEQGKFFIECKQFE